MKKDMTKKRKPICAAVLVLLLFACLCVPARAEDNAARAAGNAPEAETEGITLPPAYAALPDSLPEELTPLLPDGLFSTDPDEALAAVREGVSLPGMLSALLGALGLRLPDAVRLLSTLLGLLLISSLLGHLSAAVGGRAGELTGFIIRLAKRMDRYCQFAVAAALVSLTVGVAQTVTTFLSQLNRLCAGMLPVMGTLYVLGGNLTQATVGEGLMLVFLNVAEYLCADVTPAVCGICLSLSLLSALGLRYRMEAIGSWVRKAYTGFLGAITFLLSALLGCQSVLSARADSLRMKGIKYAVGNLLPVAGSAVSGSLGSVAAGVDLLRSICGVCGVLLLGLLLLPVLVELLLFRAVIRLASVAASSLDCAADARLLDDVAELYGYMAGAVSLCSVFFILTLCVLIACGSALG